MPVLTSKEITEKRYGMVCDRCGKRDEHGCNDFVVEHTCGYDSALDMGSISFALCDNCLLELALRHIPGAIFTQDRSPVDREELQKRLPSHQARKTFEDLG